MIRPHVTLLVLALAWLCSPTLTTAAPSPHAPHPPQTSASPGLEVYSPHALRQAKIILQLKLLELKKQRLERVRKALEHNIPIDQIMKQVS